MQRDHVVARVVEQVETPPGQLVHARLQRPAALGQLVDQPRRGRRQLPALHQPRRVEVAQPLREEVRPHAGQPVAEIGVALRTEQQLADDQQRPALPEQVQRTGHRTELAVGPPHSPDVISMFPLPGGKTDGRFPGHDHQDRVQAGHPSWVDLGTTDVAAAKAFYGPLFGWEFEDQTGTAASSSIASPSSAAQRPPGSWRSPPRQRDMGIPPMWNSYVSVTDADATTEKVEAAGGAVFMPPMDVMDAGRMCGRRRPHRRGDRRVAAQPAHRRGGRQRARRASRWNELVTPDVDKAAAFYNQVFGWKARTEQMGPMTYTEFLLDDESIAGAMPPPMEGIPPSWGVYFAVADTDATVKDAKQPRRHACMSEPTDIPPGRFAVLADPQGAVFLVIKSTPQS